MFFLHFRLNLDNLIQVRNFAASFLCFSLVSACDKIIYENFESLIDSPLLLSLTGAELSKLLESDDLQVSSEEAVFHALIAWCEHKPTVVPQSRSLQSLTAVAEPSVDVMSSSVDSSRTPLDQSGDDKSDNSRLRFLSDLLSCVRLPLLSAHFIRDVVSKNAYIRSDIRCR